MNILYLHLELAIVATLPVARRAIVQPHSWLQLHLQRYFLDSTTPSLDKVLINKKSKSSSQTTELFKSLPKTAKP